MSREQNEIRILNTSYFVVMAEKDLATDIQLISELGGVTQVASEWLEKFELACKVRDKKDAELASLAALRLTGGAFAV